LLFSTGCSHANVELTARRESASLVCTGGAAAIPDIVMRSWNCHFNEPLQRAVHGTLGMSLPPASTAEEVISRLRLSPMQLEGWRAGGPAHLTHPSALCMRRPHACRRTMLEVLLVLPGIWIQALWQRRGPRGRCNSSALGAFVMSERATSRSPATTGGCAAVSASK